MLAAVLILAGIVLLVLGVVTSSTVLTAVALGLGVVAVVLLLLPLGRRTTPAAEPAATPAKPKPAEPKAAKPELKPKPKTAKPRSAPATSEDASVVLVVAGRHRFHRPGCELLDGKDTERLAPDEAAEEGFTACSRCRPAVATADDEGSATTRV